MPVDPLLRLTLSLALTRMKWGKPRDTIPSRFLFELIGKAENPHKEAGASARPTRRTAKKAAPKPLAGKKVPVKKLPAKKTPAKKFPAAKKSRAAKKTRRR